MKKYRAFLAIVAASASVGFGSVLPATAANFIYKENNTAVFSANTPPEIIENGNIRTVMNAAVLSNLSDRTTDEIIYAIPFLWTQFEGQSSGLSWDNQLDGWLTDDYDGQGNTLVVQLDNFSERSRLDNFADATGKAPVPLALPCNDGPSCVPELPFNLPPLSQDAEDAIPIFNFGRFAPGETKTLDAMFSFNFEDNRTGTLPLLPFVGTFSPISQAVPEPTTVLALLAMGGVTMLWKRQTPKA